MKCLGRIGPGGQRVAQLRLRARDTCFGPAEVTGMKAGLLNHFGGAAPRNKGTYDNLTAIRRDEPETTALNGLQGQRIGSRPVRFIC
jgi:hypothetical protein